MSEERYYYTIDRIDADGRRTYGCGVLDKERAMSRIVEQLDERSARSDRAYYTLRALGCCTPEEAWERAEDPAGYAMPLGRMPHSSWGED